MNWKRRKHNTWWAWQTRHSQGSFLTEWKSCQTYTLTSNHCLTSTWACRHKTQSERSTSADLHENKRTQFNLTDKITPSKIIQSIFSGPTKTRTALLLRVATTAKKRKIQSKTKTHALSRWDLCKCRAPTLKVRKRKRLCLTNEA